MARRRERWTGIMIAVALLLAFGLSGRRVWRIASGRPPPAAGTMAPGFIAPQLEGGDLSLGDMQGKVVLIDFWATWCPPCVASMPALSRMQEQFGKRGFSVVGINQEPGDEARVRAFIASRNLDFQMVVDPGPISLSYGVHSLPSSFLIDESGYIRAAFRGLVSERRLERAIEAVLDERDARISAPVHSAAAGS